MGINNKSYAAPMKGTQQSLVGTAVAKPFATKKNLVGSDYLSGKALVSGAPGVAKPQQQVVNPAHGIARPQAQMVNPAAVDANAQLSRQYGIAGGTGMPGGMLSPMAPKTSKIGVVTVDATRKKPLSYGEFVGRLPGLQKDSDGSPAEYGDWYGAYVDEWFRLKSGIEAEEQQNKAALATLTSDTGKGKSPYDGVSQGYSSQQAGHSIRDAWSRIDDDIPGYDPAIMDGLKSDWADQLAMALQSGQSALNRQLAMTGMGGGAVTSLNNAAVSDAYNAYLDKVAGLDMGNIQQIEADQQERISNLNNISSLWMQMAGIGVQNDALLIEWLRAIDAVVGSTYGSYIDPDDVQPGNLLNVLTTTTAMIQNGNVGGAVDYLGQALGKTYG